MDPSRSDIAFSQVCSDWVGWERSGGCLGGWVVGRGADHSGEGRGRKGKVVAAAACAAAPQTALPSPPQRALGFYQGSRIDLEWTVHPMWYGWVAVVFARAQGNLVGQGCESDGEWWLLVERGRVQPFPGPALITRAGRISGDPPSTISRQVVTSGSRRGGNRSTLARRGGGREGALQTSISQECANETAALLIRSKSCN